MKHIIFFLYIVFSVTVFAQKGYDSIPEEFFRIFEQKGSDAAIDYVYATNKYVKGNIQANIKVKTELKKIINLIGVYRGYEQMETKIISPSYVQLTYLAKFDRQPLKFIFVLYKPADRWQMQRMRFDDKIAPDKNIK